MLYLNLSTGSVLYGEDGKATEASNGNNPGLTFGDVITLGLQLLNTESVDETTALYNNPYTGYTGKTVTASAVVDIDYKTETTAAVATAIVAATPISTIDLTYTPAETPVRTHGKIYLGADRAESVYYNNCVLKTAGVYTFTLSDSAYTATAFTPTNGYILASAAYVRTAACACGSSACPSLVAIGSVRVMRVPRPDAGVSMAIWPACDSTSRFAMGSPSPIPVRRGSTDSRPGILKNFWKTCSRYSAGMPGPSSSTSRRTYRSPSRDALTLMVVFTGAYLLALSMSV